MQFRDAMLFQAKIYRRQNRLPPDLPGTLTDAQR